ncbi:MAG: GlgB N-terminal domain-containing protein, partial [Planctomycetota bacterium]
MRTTLSLQSVSDLIHGETADPIGILGPHRVDMDGRRMIAVRSYLPDARQVWLVDPSCDAVRPMRRVHP